MIHKSSDRKIRLLISFGLIFLCLLTNLVFNLTIRTQNIENTKIASHEKAVAIGEKITDIFDTSSMITEYLAKNTTVLKYLESVNEYEDIKSNNYFPALREIQNVKDINEYFHLAWVGNIKTNFFMDSTGYVSDKSFDAEKRPWYGKMMNSREIAFSEPYIELGNNEIVISAIKKVPLKNGTGFASIDFSFAGIEEIFTDISLGEKDEIFLLNGEGNYLYNKDKNKVLTSNFFVDNRIDRNVENQVRSSDLIFQEINRGSRKYYLSTTKLENSDWYVVILIDKGSLFERIDNIFLIDFIISFLVLVVIIVIINGHIASYFSSLRDVRRALVNISEKKFDETEIAEGNKDELVKEIFEYLSELNYSLRNIVDKESDSRLAKIEKEIEDIKLSMEKVYGDLQQPINVIATTESFLKKLVEINSKKADNGLMTSDDLDKLLHDVEEVNSIVKNNLNKIIKHSEKLNYSKFNS